MYSLNYDLYDTIELCTLSAVTYIIHTFYILLRLPSRPREIYPER